MNIIDQLTIGEYVAQDFRTAAVFTKYKIDFCCKGDKTLDEVCQKKGLSTESIQEEVLSVLELKNDFGINFKSWPTDLLIDYILKTHHVYVEENTPILFTFLDKLCKVHGERHPELFEVNKLFKISGSELLNHLQKEEVILFPFIKTMEKALVENTTIEQPHFGSVYNPIAMLRGDHQTEGDLFAKISELTNNYTPPDDACNTYKVTYSMLQEFEQDLHKHIHLENNILFPKAQNMEEQFSILS
jgi:regulator of cell morphogenesis and NO signaling